MKSTSVIIWCATIAIAGAQANELNDRDREDILKRLEAIQDAANSRVDSRFRLAIAAYRAAMGSDEAAFGLYLNCIEKVDFTDQNRSGQEFREWRRSNDDRLKNPALRRALRHQLRWLVLTLQAASTDADLGRLAVSAQEIIDSIVSDASSLAGAENILNQSVTGSPFARAYEINRVEVENWVLAPGQISQVYERILLPRHRLSRRPDSLRTLWTKRIQQEMILAEKWRRQQERGGRVGMASALTGAELEKFVAEQVPVLQWQMELDVFRHGDPQGAAPRMLAHIERHITHKDATDWTQQLKDLLAPVLVMDAPSENEAEPGPASRGSDFAPLSDLEPEPEPATEPTKETVPPDPDSIFLE